MRTFVCLVLMLLTGTVAVACPTAVSVSVPQTYCPAPTQADPVVNPPLGIPLRAEAPQVYQSQTQVLRLATQDYGYNYNDRAVQLLRVDNHNYRTRNVQVLRVDNHNTGRVAIVQGRTRLASNSNATVVNVQSRSGLFGLRKNNVAVQVGGGGPNVSVKAGGRGPAVSVKAGGGVKVQVKAGGRKRGRGR